MPSTNPPSMRPVIVNLAYVLILLPFVMLLQACGHRPQKQPADLPKLPRPPSLSTELSQTNYSQSALMRIKTWREKLKATQMMSD